MGISSKITNPVRGHPQWINLCACCWSIFHLRGCRTCNELGWGSPQHSLNNYITGWSYHQWHARKFALGEEMRSLFYLVLLARIAGSLYSSVYKKNYKSITNLHIFSYQHAASLDFSNWFGSLDLQRYGSPLLSGAWDCLKQGLYSSSPNRRRAVPLMCKIFWEQL